MTARGRAVAAFLLALPVAVGMVQVLLAGAASGAGVVVTQAQAGPLQGAQLLGSSPQGTSGDPAEAWAFRLHSGLPPVVDGQELVFGPGDGQQLVLLRYTRGEGWRMLETPRDEAGDPYRGGSPRIGRVTSRGGLGMIVDDATRPTGEQRLVLLRDRGGTARILPAPGAGVLSPGEGSTPAEQVSATALAVRDGAGDRTEVFIPIVGPTRESGIAHWDGAGWTREPICVADPGGVAPAGCGPAETLTGSGTNLTSIAISAANGGDAWLLAKAQPSAARGIVLFQRRTSGPPRWVLRDDLGAPVFTSATTPSRGVQSVTALSSPDALTATASGVWVDARLIQNGVQGDATIFFDGTESVTWCDGADALGPLCDIFFGLRFDTRTPSPHRSFAWSGGGFGTRAIGPVLRPGDGNGAGAYATLEGATFVSRPSFGGLQEGLAFGAPDEGWIGLSHVTREPRGAELMSWSVPVRRPLTAIATEPGHEPGDPDAAALAVGFDGTVLRHAPDQGWDSEVLLGSGGVSRPLLRGVAWPTPEFAYAVGDDGAMWRWRDTTGLWEPDPAAPFDFVQHLSAIAFQPGKPDSGYAVGRAGTLLGYGKSWEQEGLPEEVRTGGPLDGPVDFTSVAFAGSQALVVSPKALLVNDGEGWRVDRQAQVLIDRAGGRLLVVAGLPDGGAVAAGTNIVIERDGPGAPWRPASHPLPGATVVAVAAFREAGAVRAVVSLGSEIDTLETSPLPNDPTAPPPRLGTFSASREGSILRETAVGWRDEQHEGLVSPTVDGARKPDPVLAFSLGAGGSGWAVGGFSGRIDSTGSAVQSEAQRRLLQTAAAFRYDPGTQLPAPRAGVAPVPLPPGPVRFAVGGHAQCLAACAGLESLGLMPDRTLARAVQQQATTAARSGGPRAFLYTGGSTPANHNSIGDSAEEARLAGLLSSTGGLPVFAAVSPGDAAAGVSGGFQSAFAAFPAPFGAPGGARTHYALDTTGPEGTVRVVVIDNSTGSLVAADGHQNPAEAQEPWLRAVLADAKAKGIASVVMGNRSLSERQTGAATDAAQVAAILRDEGASTYVYDGAGQQRLESIPTGSGEVPSFASGTLGYRSSLDIFAFGVPGTLLLELDLAHRDPQTNRAPVAVRLIPTIGELALEAVDGRVIQRSRPALFNGLGRRPLSGDSTDGNGFDGRSDPYVPLPLPPCAGGCAGRIEPEVRFTSSEPDIANFVMVDPNSTNPRKPYVDPRTDKVVVDETSGLLCAFNPGTTTVNVQAGGLSYSTEVTVRGGSVLRPCGTTPLDPKRFPAAGVPAPATVPPPPSQSPLAEDPAPLPPPPPPPPPLTPVASPPSPQPVPFLPPAAALVAPLPLLVPLPPAPTPRPIPPSGTSPVTSPTSVTQPATKVEEEEEEEIAPERQQGAVAYEAPEDAVTPSLVLCLLALSGALAVTGLRQARSGRRDRDRDRQRRRLAMNTVRTDHRPPWRPQR
jgi:hypothetical protein